MAMMASASAGNPYEHYDNTQIEQDLIDPDDGIAHPHLSLLHADHDVLSEYQRPR